jgi:hypothetical protein
MKALILPVLLAGTLALGGCSSPATGYPMVFDSSVQGVASELINPGSTYRARLEANDVKCREEASKPGGKNYDECRRQLDSEIH